MTGLAIAPYRPLWTTRPDGAAGATPRRESGTGLVPPGRWPLARQPEPVTSAPPAPDRRETRLGPGDRSTSAMLVNRPRYGRRDEIAPSVSTSQATPARSPPGSVAVGDGLPGLLTVPRRLGAWAPAPRPHLLPGPRQEDEHQQEAQCRSEPGAAGQCPTRGAVTLASRSAEVDRRPDEEHPRSSGSHHTEEQSHDRHQHRTPSAGRSLPAARLPLPHRVRAMSLRRR
jgi:hypothetical protein